MSEDSKRDGSSREGSGRATDSDILGSRNNVVVKIGMVGDAQVRNCLNILQLLKLSIFVLNCRWGKQPLW